MQLIAAFHIARVDLVLFSACAARCGEHAQNPEEIRTADKGAHDFLRITRTIGRLMTYPVMMQASKTVIIWNLLSRLSGSALEVPMT